MKYYITIIILIIASLSDPAIVVIVAPAVAMIKEASVAEVYAVILNKSADVMQHALWVIIRTGGRFRDQILSWYIKADTGDSSLIFTYCIFSLLSLF